MESKRNACRILVKIHTGKRPLEDGDKFRSISLDNGTLTEVIQGRVLLLAEVVPHILKPYC